MGLWGHLQSGIESAEFAKLVKADKLDKASQSYKLTEENTNKYFNRIAKIWDNQIFSDGKTKCVKIKSEAI